MEKANPKVSRISISLPEELLMALDNMVTDRGFDSRSQAICDMITNQIDEHNQEVGEEIMTGTLNLVFDYSVGGLQKRLTDLQHEYVNEVISALNVNLTGTRTLAVILLQGPANQLKIIADKMIALRGVNSGKLILSSTILPPIHPLPATKN